MMKRASHKHPEFTPGFTLLELLVSSAVLAIVLVIMLGAMTTTLGLWRSTDNAIAADREGRSANLLLYDDLSSAFVPRSKPRLWPRVEREGTFLAFLTRKPADYLDSAGGDVGGLFYVEYLVENNALKRRLVGSRETYNSILQDNFPTNSTNAFQVLATNIIPASVAMRRTVVADTPADLQAITPNFVPVSRGWIEDTNITTFADRPDLVVGQEFPQGTSTYRVLDTTNIATTNSATGDIVNRVDVLARRLYRQPTFMRTPFGDLPQAIEVNLAATDMGTLANTELLENPSIIVRNPGFYHFRVTLFPAP
jgi:prepilin-type N-terminal cleavage/methylation domain-containing protein